MTRILIADADPAFRKALILLLSHKMGIKDICEAGDVNALLHAFVTNPPDILFLSWSLYGTPGPEACRLLRRGHPDLKIILLSVNPDDAVEANAAGALFLRKGARADEVLVTIKSLITSPISD